jgi:hypothetical protein
VNEAFLKNDVSEGQKDLGKLLTVPSNRMTTQQLKEKTERLNRWNDRMEVSLFYLSHLALILYLFVLFCR